MHVPVIFRKWSAIAALGAVVEQKVWVTTTSAPVCPNLFVFLVGHPGTGKTKSIRRTREYLREIPEFHFAPISFTWAALVDAMVRAKRNVVIQGDAKLNQLEYNSMVVASDELGTFMHQKDNEMAAGLSAMYDVDAYTHDRRGGEIRIKIAKPQLTLLCGATPKSLNESLPEAAWGQGFTSRTIMVFSDERLIGDDFALTSNSLSPDLIHDLKVISTTVGQFKVTEEYQKLALAWQEAGMQPAPTHPLLVYYNSRRKVNLYKLSMISAIDRSDVLLLTRDDFNRAMNWLVQAEIGMEEIFKGSVEDSDHKAMEELYHFVQISDKGKGVGETQLVNKARQLVRASYVMQVLDLMEKSGMIKATHLDKRTGMRVFVALKINS